MFWPCHVKGNPICYNDVKVCIGFSKVNLKEVQSSLQKTIILNCARIQIGVDDISCQYSISILGIFFYLLSQGQQYASYHAQPLFQEHEGYLKLLETT
jgi:hypothetical protein